MIFGQDFMFDGVGDLPVEIGTGAAQGAASGGGSFNGLSAVSADEYPIVSAFSYSSSTVSISGITVGGQACTILVTSGAKNNFRTAIAIGPKGATGTVQVSHSGAVSWCGAAVVGVKNLKSVSAISNDTASGTTLAGSLTVKKDGLVFGSAFTTNGGVWTGATLRTSATIPGASTAKMTTAAAVPAADGASAISVTSTSTGAAACFVSLR